MLTCTWAPTVFQGPKLVKSEHESTGATSPATLLPAGDDLPRITRKLVERYEALGLSHLLIAQRWWGSGEEIEASSLDCLAMTSYFASCTERMKLVTAVHPGFFQPTAIAKWGATLDLLTGGRWGINVTSGWNLREFDMYGIDALTHDARYRRSAEFIEVLRGAWNNEVFSYRGDYYQVEDLRLEPRPATALEVFQGGQSDAAISMAGQHSDWMFLNGGQPERIAGIIERARSAASENGRSLHFAMYAAPLCRATDEEAWVVIDDRLERLDPELVQKRRESVSGAEGMWEDGKDPLSQLDTNEGYAPRLIGSPESIFERIELYRELGIDMLHTDVRDALFVEEVLPALHQL